MKPVDEIIELLSKYPKHEFDPADFVEQAEHILARACDQGNEYDPREIKKAQDASNAFGHVANLLLENGYQSASSSLLISAWNRLGMIQREEGKRIYRAGIAWYLARLYLQLRDKGSAKRWALLTQADDLLGEHSEGGGAGRQMLLTVLGMKRDELDKLSKISSRNLEAIDERNSDWSMHLAFAEDVVTKFALQYPESSHLFSTPSSQLEFSISLSYLCSLIEEVEREDLPAAVKGSSLEDLASYIFMLIQGWCPRRNLIDEYLSYETDLVIRNLCPSSNLPSDLLGRHFIVECKNWKKPIGVQEVGYFLYRMRLTHAKFGVILSRSGITGDETNERAAHSIIRKAFHEDGNICIVLDRNDIESLLTENSSFWSMLLEKIERVRFGISRRGRSDS